MIAGTGTKELTGLRVLAKLGDTVTTDHISPAGFIGQQTPAGQYLLANGVAPADFNSYGARRGHHEVMVRGTLANIRLQNQLATKQGGFEVKVRFDAPIDKKYYAADGILPLVVATKMAKGWLKWTYQKV